MKILYINILVLLDPQVIVIGRNGTSELAVSSAGLLGIRGGVKW
jgi:hypothetical protein